MGTTGGTDATGSGGTSDAAAPPEAAGDPSTLPGRAAASDWVAAEPGLAGWVADLDGTAGPAKRALAYRASRLAQPGPVPPARVARHVGAAGVSRAVRAATRLPDLRDLVPLRDPRRWVLDTAVEGFVDQLALGGPASAEVARIIEGSGALFPSVLRNELGQRGIRPLEVTHTTAADITGRALTGVELLEAPPVLNLPVSELRVGRLDVEGDGIDHRDVLVRIRRPGVARELQADVRMQAALATAVQRAVPTVGGMHPLGFVELVARMALEATDLRNEALNLTELAVNLEALGADGIDIAHPVAGRATERVVVLEHVEGVPFERFGGVLADPQATLSALMSLTLESALLYGTFWADPAPEHLLVQPGGRLAIVGAGVVGHLPLSLKRAGIGFLKSLFTGDAEGQVAAMQLAGAAPGGLDTAALVADLAKADALQPSTIMFGGEQALLAGLNEAVRLMLKHRLRPPVEVVLLLRTMFALGRLSEQLLPEGGGPMAGLLGLLPRLPALLAQAEDES
ncbi:MAG: AarF/UbiB family protein [Acidimicrobiales bacterium]